MKKILSTIIALSLSASLTATANDVVSKSDLVGKFYGGVHGAKIWADDDRLLNPAPNSELDSADGFGAEVGYRYSELLEFRFLYTDLTIETKNSIYADKDGSAVAADVLFFPMEENIYFLAGLNQLDMEDKDISADLGAGYRHHFTDKFAVYLEGKMHYEFDDAVGDFSTQLGLIYFFGDSKKPMLASTKKAKPMVQEEKNVNDTPKQIDSDGDGVLDIKDNCPNSPTTNKVDQFGCTIFTEKNSTMNLLINFANNKSDINTADYAEVEKAAKFLQQHPHVNLVIEGHSSAQGAAAYNKKLSQKRADAVVALLVSEFAIDNSRLSAMGYGEERLINNANTAEAHAENRRIQATVQTKTKVAVKR